MFRVLHLSDIHIGATYKDSESIACKVASDIGYNGLSGIKCIVVTGDIFEGRIKPDDLLINEAVKFFEVLLKEINYNQNDNLINKEDIIFVPGNHDLIRVDSLDERWSKYKKFLKQFYGDIPVYYNTENYCVLKVYHNYKVAFVGFNSCQIEKKKLFDDKYIEKFNKHISEMSLEDYGIKKANVIEVLKNEVADEYDDFGHIPLAQITPLEREIKKLDNYVVIALFHHHFYLFPEIAQEFGDSSLIRNYTEVIQHLKYMNVSIVLHGHKHFDLERPYIMEDYYNSSDNIIDVFAGGSVGTDRKERHTFSIMDVYDTKDDIKLIHNKFVYSGEHLEPIVKKQIPPQKIVGRIVKLLEILKNLNPDAFKEYTDMAYKSFKTYDSCRKLIEWISEAITGFTGVYKFLDDDYKNILFLLYAVNYRVISYKVIVEKNQYQSYFESSSKNWRSFYDTHLAGRDFCISTNEYHELFKYKDLKKITAVCDRILNNCENRKTSIYLAFTMLGIFFSDLYLVMTEYADDFKESIKYKINIKIEDNKFHENVPAPRIEIKSDADRRSVYVQLLCNEATAHKMAVLFVKEFDLLINKFEDYFKIIGLKLYYLLPKIDKDNMKNTLDNYNFEAYIPTLLPLLTGDNIYPSKVVFVRELIQNSIDAIAVREAKDEEKFAKRIMIEIANDENKKRYFKIADNGTGMDRYKIERYFTSIGRSFYSGEEYQDLNISYKPISNFGIGFLSSFMVCQEIDVKTRYFLDNSEGLKLHIPNYDGCFFIELDNEANVGTEIKLYLDCDLSNQNMVDYIKKSMLDIKYNILIKYLNDRNCETQLEIPAHFIREKSKIDDFKFFIPLTEKGEVLDIDYAEVSGNRYIEKYEYGILIRKENDMDVQSQHIVLNAGILVEQANLMNLFSKDFSIDSIPHWREPRRPYNIIYFNFPSNWLQVDVSRENVTGFTDMIVQQYGKSKGNTLGEKIARCLYKQIISFEIYAKTEQKKVPLIYLQEVIQNALDFAKLCNTSDINKELRKMYYHLIIEFSNKGVTYKIRKMGKSKNRITVEYIDDSAKIQHRVLRKKLEPQLAGFRSHGFVLNDKLKKFKFRFGDIPRIMEEFIYRNDIYIDQEHRYQLDSIVNELGFDIEYENKYKIIFELLTVFLLEIPEKELLNKKGERLPIMFLLENVALNYLTVNNMDEGITVNYENIGKNILKKWDDNWLL